VWVKRRSGLNEGDRKNSFAPERSLRVRRRLARHRHDALYIYLVGQSKDGKVILTGHVEHMLNGRSGPQQFTVI